MLKKFQQVQEEWGGSSEVIDHWLEKRQALLVEYVKLASLQPAISSNVTTLPTQEELQKFSQHLVDYISEGHFKIYDMVMEKWAATGFQTTE